MPAATAVCLDPCCDGDGEFALGSPRLPRQRNAPNSSSAATAAAAATLPSRPRQRASAPTVELMSDRDHAAAWGARRNRLLGACAACGASGRPRHEGGSLFAPCDVFEHALCDACWRRRGTRSCWDCVARGLERGSWSEASVGRIAERLGHWRLPAR